MKTKIGPRLLLIYISGFVNLMEIKKIELVHRTNTQR